MALGWVLTWGTGVHRGDAPNIIILLSNCNNFGGKGVKRRPKFDYKIFEHSLNIIVSAIILLFIIILYYYLLLLIIFIIIFIINLTVFFLVK